MFINKKTNEKNKQRIGAKVICTISAFFMTAGLMMNVSLTTNVLAEDSVSFSVERDDHSLYDSSNQYILAAYYDKVVVDSSYKYADKINAAINKDCEAFFGTTDLNDALEWAEVDPPDNGYCYYCCADAEVTKNEGGILSVKITTHWFVGGVSTIDYYGLNFNLYTGEKLNISEAFSMNDSEMADYFKTYTLQYINLHTNINWWDTDIDAKSMVNLMGIDDFLYFIQNDEIVLCYSTYFLGPGSEGCITVNCPLITTGLTGSVKADNDTDSEITLIVNGKTIETAVKPYIDNGTTMVPIRGVFEALGADVAYDAETKTVIITAEEKGKTISLPVGSSSAGVNGETVSLQNPAVIVNGSTMVPLRFVAEALDADVNWNGNTKTVTITD